MKRMKLTLAVAYYRMSTDAQDKSIESQREAVEAYAKKHGYKIVREYVDEGISGDATHKRRQFQRMIADAEEGEFVAILVWDQDRFGRFDSIEAGRWIYPLREAGVSLVTVADGEIDWRDFASRLIYSVKQEGKHQFLRDLSRNVVRGLIKRAKKGLWTGHIPYGYALGDDGRLVFGNPREVATVRRIFRRRLDRVGYRVIARELNQDEIPSPSGGQWSHDSVRIVLERIAYTGAVTSGTKHRGKYFTAHDGEVAPVQKGQATSGVVVEDAHPAIIDRQIWDQAQSMKVKAKPHCREGRKGAPLAGLLFCGRCGSVMYAQSLRRSSGQRTPNYVCGRYHKGHGCGYCTVPQDAILEAVADAIREKILMGSQEALAKRIEAKLEERANGGTAAELKAWERERAKLTRQIEKATDRLLIVDDSIVPELEKRILDLRRQRGEISALIASQERKGPKLDPSEIAANAWRMADVFEQSDPERVRLTVSRIIDRIVLDFEKGKKHGRGQKYDLAGGSIHFCPTQCAERWA